MRVEDSLVERAMSDVPPVDQIVSLPEFELHARAMMTHMAYEYVASGAADEHTLHWNRTRYDEILLRPRVLVDVGQIDMTVPLLGQTLPFPFMLAPTAYQRIVHPDGELGTVRGAGAMGATYVVSSATNTAVEEIARAATAPLWFQLYVQSDLEFTRDVVQRAEGAGCRALCMTVDTPILGARNRQMRAGFHMQPELSTPHLFDMTAHGRLISPERTTLTWDAVTWLRSVTKLPVVLKGILDPDDAALAIDAGAAAIIVSNHGARNLDTTPATIDALPAVAARVAKRVPVLVDGGIRRGTDILKAIALGADATLIGRPHCYGLAVGGAEGVSRVIQILVDELRMAMMLTGRANIRSVDATVLW
jgi:4-hydroxymandelate oxidase